MMRTIRSFIGNLTLPKDVCVCSLGDYWVEVDGDPCSIGYNKGVWYYEDTGYKHHYQKIKQTFWGYWIKESLYLSKHTKLNKLGEQLCPITL